MNNETIDNSKEEVRSQLEKYMQAKIPVHIVFKIKKGQEYKKHPKTGGPMPMFYNGIIIGKKSEDVYIIHDRKLGETYFLIDEVFSVTVWSISNEKLIEEIKKKSGFKKGEGVSDDDINLINDFPKEEKNGRN
jgi:hypothetical protein